ncbi:MAG: sigma-70 family RNA polymerase sigma factor [Lacunisphaera sp.]
MATDAELLQRYVHEHAEAAFAELVRRHLNLVYAAALRRTNGRSTLAEEIAQKVFTDLARKAAQLTNHPTLTGWLYRSTRYVAIDVARAEQRSQRLAKSLAAMPENQSPAEPPTDWGRLRPVLDEALDDLKESDREIMLLRFFQGLTFTEVGARLNIKENAARMRTERALEKLRVFLDKRGVTSTATLVGLLASETLVAAPTYLAASVTTTAMTAAPVGTLATFFTNLLANKMAAVSASVVLGVTITTMAWAKFVPGVSEAELMALRSENAQLTQAAAPGASPASVAAAVDEIAAHTTTVLQAIEKRLAKIHTTENGSYHNHGQATPRDAVRSLGWAADSGDIAALAKIVTYDEKGREIIRAIQAAMPATIRAQYRTPEELGAFFYVAGTLLQPVPGADIWEKRTAASIATKLGPGRVLLRQPGQTQGGIEARQTAEGWRVVLPEQQLEKRVERILSNEMLAKLGIIDQ